MVSHVSITPRDALVCYQHIWMLTVSSIPCWHMLFNKWLKKPTNEWTNDCLWNMLKFIFISRQTTANLTVFYSHKAPPIQPADNESVSHSCKAMIMTWAHMRNHPLASIHSIWRWWWPWLGFWFWLSLKLCLFLRVWYGVYEKIRGNDLWMTIALNKRDMARLMFIQMIRK